MTTVYVYKNLDSNNPINCSFHHFRKTLPILIFFSYCKTLPSPLECLPHQFVPCSNVVDYGCGDVFLRIVLHHWRRMVTRCCIVRDLRLAKRCSYRIYPKLPHSLSWRILPRQIHPLRWRRKMTCNRMAFGDISHDGLTNHTWPH